MKYLKKYKVFESSEIEDIKSKEWFEQNKSVKECLSESKSKLKDLSENHGINLGSSATTVDINYKVWSRDVFGDN